MIEVGSESVKIGETRARIGDVKAKRRIHRLTKGELAKVNRGRELIQHYNDTVQGLLEAQNVIWWRLVKEHSLPSEVEVNFETGEVFSIDENDGK
jgi:hypothetical protein